VTPLTQRHAWQVVVVVLAGLALAASANSIANGYAYDDVALIPNSTRIHSWDGWWREFGRTYWPGADGYRPLTILGWRAQWATGGGAAVFHGVNVALHVGATVAAFWMMGAFFPMAVAGIAAALFAVHPVHVEAIANVVGQSDLAVALLTVAAVALYVHARRAGRVGAGRWSAIIALYAAACLFKEHGIMLPLLVLSAEVLVVRDAAPLRQRLLAMRVPFGALAIVALAYLWARSRVVVGGESGFAPYIVFQALDLSDRDRVLTMIGASTEWLRLMLWPARLMTQYAPQYLDVAQGPDLRQLPGLLVLLGTIGLAIACWRRSPVTTFGILWLIITLLPASNFLVPAGFIIAERTLYLPSLGAMIAVCSALPWLYERFGERRGVQLAGAAVLAVLLALGIGRSISRNRVWRDDATLHAQGVIDAPNSYRAHFQLGVHYFQTGRFAEGEAHYRRAIALFPHDPIMAYGFAEQLRTVGRCDAALPIYQWFFAARPDARQGRLGYALCLLQFKRYEEARASALTWMSRGGRPSMGRAVLASAKAGLDSAANGAARR
jgi:tetratricopeptide (TPR) repeat protein